MYQRILAAIDGSRCARRALDEAMRLAKASGGSVVAVCVIEGPAQHVDVGTVFGEDVRPTAAAEAANAALEEAQQLFRDRHVTGSVRALDAYGESVGEVLMRAAVETEAEVIVMGTHGRRGLRRMLLGSIAESVLRIADRPVLLVRDAPDEPDEPDEPGAPA
jgi:nucleotide-binding universal stress UspA family protein